MKILVIDDSGQISACLAEVEADLESRIDEIQALNVLEQMRPELVFLSYAVCGEQTQDYIRQVVKTLPSTSLIVIGEQASQDCVLRCLLSGAKGYQELQDLRYYSVRLVQAINRGEAWVSRRMVASLLDAIRQLML
ncbi:response regulator transcription factor [Methylomonas methanica]|uniref:Response regulatory domain-containing protein n=1 Tax=Methylomonas methanica (strain DSM 25384 / MC09) TaxID=857087 RepID=F9ZZC1_METMM|nr:response regulator transcription factor [Methylomonas methanica]AEG02314.1 hypothetical protein Metme_3960 [Methylomonas methanica MC09]